MTKPSRLSPIFDSQTYFVTTSTWQKRSLFQVETWAKLFLETLYGQRMQKKFRFHAFVLMPDHFHLLLTPMHGITLERSMQLIKGGFSHRMRTERPNLEIWQRGFTDRRIRNAEEFVGFKRYIHENPVKAGLSPTETKYPYSSAHQGFELDPAPAYLSG